MAFYQNPKDVFADSVVSLLEKHPIEDITVQDITNKASSSRTTFYRYFRDKYDLVAYVYERTAGSLVEVGLNTSKSNYELALDICVFMYSKPLFFKNAFAHTGQNSFFDFWVQYTEEVWGRRLREKMQAQSLPDDLRLLVKSYIAGVCTVVKAWAMSDMKQPPEYIAKICDDSCPPRLREFVD